MGTAWTAAGVGCAAAAIAWTFARTEPTPARKAEVRLRLRISSETRLPWSLLLVTMGAGAVLLGLEVIWVRLLRLYVASTSIALLRHARGRPGRNRPWQHQREPHSRSHSAATGTVAPPPYPLCQCNASFLSVFSCAGSPTQRSFVRSRFRPTSRVTFPGFNVSGSLSVGCAASRDRDLRSIRGRRPDEQHGPYHLFQYDRRGLRAFRRSISPSAPAWIPVELDSLRGHLRRACFVNE